mgnify:CR=1 FL=1
MTLFFTSMIPMFTGTVTFQVLTVVFRNLLNKGKQSFFLSPDFLSVVLQGVYAHLGFVRLIVYKFELSSHFGG